MNCRQVFGKQFRIARTEQGFSQGEVASALGVGRSVISSWENGNSSPLLERLDDISRVLRKPITFFFEAAENEEQFGIGDRELTRVLQLANENFARIRVQVEDLLGSIFLASKAFEALAHSEATKYDDMQDTGFLDETSREFARDNLRRLVAFYFKKLDHSLPSTLTSDFDSKIDQILEHKFFD